MKKDLAGLTAASIIAFGAIIYDLYNSASKGFMFEFSNPTFFAIELLLLISYLVRIVIYLIIDFKEEKE